MEPGRTSQKVVEPVVLDILSSGRVMTTAEINAAVKRKLPPNPTDAEPANRRNSETKYDAVISSALEKGRTLRTRGYIERVGDGTFRATPSGIANAMAFRQEVSDLGRSLDDLYPEEFW